MWGLPLSPSARPLCTRIGAHTLLCAQASIVFFFVRLVGTALNMAHFFERCVHKRNRLRNGAAKTHARAAFCCVCASWAFKCVRACVCVCVRLCAFVHCVSAAYKSAMCKVKKSKMYLGRADLVPLAIGRRAARTRTHNSHYPFHENV